MTSRPTGDSGQEDWPTGPPQEPVDWGRMYDQWSRRLRSQPQEARSHLPRLERELSKSMSRVLRYDCQREGLLADAEGWVRLEDLAECLNRPRTHLLHVVAVSFHFVGDAFTPRFEVRGQGPQEAIRATSNNEMVKRAARFQQERERAARFQQERERGEVADRGASSSAEAARPAMPAAPPRRAAVGADAIEWVEIPGGHGGVRTLRHVVSGEICRGPPPSDWAAGWVELFTEREVERQHDGGFRYYWHVARDIVRWERPQPGPDTRPPARGRRPGDCIICWNENITTALMPCGHWCACSNCAAVLHARGNGCPVCRHVIEDVRRIYDIGERSDASGSEYVQHVQQRWEHDGIVRDHTFSNGGNMTAQGTHGSANGGAAAPGRSPPGVM